MTRFTKSKVEVLNLGEPKFYEISEDSINTFMACAIRMGHTQFSEEFEHWNTSGECLSSVRCIMLRKHLQYSEVH